MRSRPAALHLLNDDLRTAVEYCQGKADPPYTPDATCALVHAVAHRREKIYFEAERAPSLSSHRLP